MAYIAIAFGAWGRGATIKEAEDKLKSVCSSKGTLYTFEDRLIYEVPGDEEPYVDDMGYICHKSGTELKLIKKVRNGKEISFNKSIIRS